MRIKYSLVSEIRSDPSATYAVDEQWIVVGAPTLRLSIRLPLRLPIAGERAVSGEEPRRASFSLFIRRGMHQGRE